MSALPARGKHLIVLRNAASYTRTDAVSWLHFVLPNAYWETIAAPGDYFADIPAEVLHWWDQQADGFLMHFQCKAEL
ncbi:MAG: hypothetical protein AB8B60_07240 [Sulfitobacter sp.]